MRAALLCVGRLKEKYWRDACEEYRKRLTRYGQVEVIEVPDAPEPAHPSPGANAQVLQTEGERILGKIRPDDVVIALAVEGNPLLGPLVEEIIETMEAGQIPQKQHYVEEKQFTSKTITQQMIDSREY